jgi:hypothetical protein
MALCAGLQTQHVEARQEWRSEIHHRTSSGLPEQGVAGSVDGAKFLHELFNEFAPAGTPMTREHPPGPTHSSLPALQPRPPCRLSTVHQTEGYVTAPRDNHAPRHQHRSDVTTNLDSVSSLLTEMRADDIPDILRRFDRVVGSRNWSHRVSQMKAAIKGNRLLDRFLRDENDIAYGLERCGDLLKRYGGLPSAPSEERVMYPAVSFAAQCLSMIDMATPVEAERLRKRVTGAFQNPDAMRALRLELTTATHFARRGHRLVWPEMVGGGTFDLLVADLGASGLEVECKSISSDKGRRIHRREAIDFHHLLYEESAQLRKTLRVGLAVVLTVPRGLPTRHGDRQAFAKRIRQQITLGSSSHFDDDSHLRITEFDLARLPNLAEEKRAEVVRTAIHDVTGTQNRESLVVGTDAGGALAFVVQSQEDDDILEATFKTLSDGAKRQLSGTRSALLVAGFDGLDGEQLLSVAAQDHDANQHPTGLAIKVSKFLSADHRDHVVGVNFLSRSALRPVTDTLVDSGGTAYIFPKRSTPFWHDDFEGLFIRNGA